MPALIIWDSAIWRNPWLYRVSMHIGFCPERNSNIRLKSFHHERSLER